MLYLKRLICLAITIPTLAFAETTVTLTYENVDSYPWTMKNGEGIDMILLEMVDEALPEVKFEYKQAPWKRCLANIETNETEGCFTASFKEERLQYGFYPGTHTGGAATPSLQLHSSSYSLYVPNDSAITVTGTLAIEGLTGKIAAPRGYSIGDDLEKNGYTVDAQSSTTLNNLKKLMSGRVDAVAALTLNGDNIVASDPEFKGKVKKIETPLVDKPYYLMFSKQFVNGNKALAEKIWNTAAEIRESQAYKDKAGAFLAK